MAKNKKKENVEVEKEPVVNNKDLDNKEEKIEAESARLKREYKEALKKEKEEKKEMAKEKLSKKGKILIGVGVGLLAAGGAALAAFKATKKDYACSSEEEEPEEDLEYLDLSGENDQTGADKDPGESES